MRPGDLVRLYPLSVIVPGIYDRPVEQSPDAKRVGDLGPKDTALVLATVPGDHGGGWVREACVLVGQRFGWISAGRLVVIHAAPVGR